MPFVTSGCRLASQRGGLGVCSVLSPIRPVSRGDGRQTHCGSDSWNLANHGRMFPLRWIRKETEAARWLQRRADWAGWRRIPAESMQRRARGRNKGKEATVHRIRFGSSLRVFQLPLFSNALVFGFGGYGDSAFCYVSPDHGCHSIRFAPCVFRPAFSCQAIRLAARRSIHDSVRIPVYDRHSGNRLMSRAGSQMSSPEFGSAHCQ